MDRIPEAVTRLSAIVTAISAIVAVSSAGTVWALDTRYWRIADQQQFEFRQLKREAKRYELSCNAGNVQDCAYWEFLKQELEDLE